MLWPTCISRRVAGDARGMPSSNWYRKYAPGDTVLEELEQEAREAKKSLWADPQPMPPWEWRKQHK
jgi:endonuclease YncB( thermonuclease family)